jgi:syndetin
MMQEIQCSDPSNSSKDDGSLPASIDNAQILSPTQDPATTSVSLPSTEGTNGLELVDYQKDAARDDGSSASSSGSPWFQLRKDAAAFVSQTLRRGRKNFWQLTTSRVAVLLSSSAVSSASTHQFLKDYEDLNIFILAGEAFCGIEALEFRQKVKAVCESYFLACHRQNIHESLGHRHIIKISACYLCMFPDGIFMKLVVTFRNEFCLNNGTYMSQKYCLSG